MENDYPPQGLAVQSLPIPVRPTRRYAVQIYFFQLHVITVVALAHVG